VDWVQEADHVIQRADGSALYNLANVVDDYDMKITHVMRSAEHLSNTPRQIFIAQALGYPIPEYAHFPVVAEPGSKNKLSKRKIADYLKNPDFRKLYEHGERIVKTLGLPTAAETFNPVIVDFYERVGYLPEAILNYIVLLGWSFDDKTEFFTIQELIDAFSIERINKGTYDAIYYGISSGDTDPSVNLDYWLSTGSFHVWNPAQAKPATPWEAEIDRLMQELTGLTDASARQARFAKVQEIFVTNLPAIFLAAPNLTTATSARVEGLEPGPLYPYLLWRADTMRLAQPH